MTEKKRTLGGKYRLVYGLSQFPGKVIGDVVNLTQAEAVRYLELGAVEAVDG